MRLSYFALLSFLCLAACQSDQVPAKEITIKEAPTVDNRPEMVKKMEKTHGVSIKENKVWQYNLALSFGGKPRFKGQITQSENMNQIKLQEPKEEILFDGKDVYVSSNKTFDSKSVRFNALTWPYFFSLPFKLNDPGTQLEELSPQTVNNIEYQRVKLTFGSGIGDAPDDWYILYINHQEQLKAAAYIVTFGGKDASEALANAHAIVYHDYHKNSETQIAKSWTFHDWDPENGWAEAIIGEASLSEIRTITPAAETFDIPKGAITVNAPQ